MKLHTLVLAVSALLACPAAGAAEPMSSYAGEHGRSIKSLSPDRIEGLLAGKGLGYAKAAELNGYRGPLHVLELADALGLTPAQREATTALRARMQQQAIVLGTDLVAAEEKLEMMFHHGHVDATTLQAQLDRIAALEASLRHAHLAAHIEQRDLLTSEQNARYPQLRGYHPGESHQGHHGH